MAKKKETVNEHRLYEIWLDLHYARGALDDRIADLTEDLKDAKALKRKTEKEYEAVTARFTQVYNRVPSAPKI